MPVQSSTHSLEANLTAAWCNYLHEIDKEPRGSPRSSKAQDDEGPVTPVASPKANKHKQPPKQPKHLRLPQNARTLKMPDLVRGGQQRVVIQPKSKREKAPVSAPDVSYTRRSN